MRALDDLGTFSDQLQRLAPGTGVTAPLQLIDTGFGATILRSANDIAIRIPHTERLAIRQQAHFSPMRRLAHLLPLPIPSPLWTIPMGYPFALGVTGYAWLPGEPPCSAALTPAIADQLGSFLAAMHAIDGDALASFSGKFHERTEVDTERSRVMNIVLPWLREIESPTVVDRLMRWWDDYRHARERAVYTPRIVHGDLWYGNLLVAPDRSRLTGVLDWENVCIDDLAQDFATLMHSGSDFTEMVLRSYVRAGGTVDEDIFDRGVWHWEFHEFTGIALALEAGDEDEALDGAHKLREGPLRGHFEE